MNRTVKLVLGGGALFLGSLTANAQGIDGSQHDLGGLGGAPDEVCVFCHTPHGSDVQASVPLWNKVLDSGVGYLRYSSLNTATLDGDEAPIGSVSLACLSCHDGQQARDTVINAPGRGGYNAAGTQIGDGSKVGDAITPIPRLGTDLTDDHPISIEYAGGACTGTFADCTPTVANGDPDFQVAQYATINNNNAWWVDTTGGTANTREKTDMILYTRDFGGTEGPSVECGSCHDPHNAGSFVVDEQVAFLRISNASSAVCLACHDK